MGEGGGGGNFSEIQYSGSLGLSLAKTMIASFLKSCENRKKPLVTLLEQSCEGLPKYLQPAARS